MKISKNQDFREEYCASIVRIGEIATDVTD